jgi:hypothetical protein
MKELCPSDYKVLWSSGPFANTVSSGVRFRVVHECGAMTEVDLRDDDVLWNATEESLRRIWQRVYGSCYCVRREVLVPCTHQRCEP